MFTDGDFEMMKTGLQCFRPSTLLEILPLGRDESSGLDDLMERDRQYLASLDLRQLEAFGIPGEAGLRGAPLETLMAYLWFIRFA